MSDERTRAEQMLADIAEGNEPDTPRDWTEKLLAEAAEGKETRSNAREHIDLFINDITGGPSVTVTPLSVTANGTYEAPSGSAYDPVTVAVPESEWVTFTNVAISDLLSTFGYDSYTAMIADIVHGDLIVQAFYANQVPCMSSGPYRQNFTTTSYAILSGYIVDDFSGNSDYRGAYIRFDSDGFYEGWRIARSGGAETSTEFNGNTLLSGRYLKR